MSAKLILYLINALIILISMIFVGVSIGIHTAIERKKNRCKCLTQAVIVDMKRESTSSNADELPAYSWYPIYEYTIHGHILTQTSRFGQAHPPFDVGQQIELYYNAHDYNDFYVPEEHSEKLVPIFKTIGNLLLTIGVICFFILKKL